MWPTQRCDRTVARPAIRRPLVNAMKTDNPLILIVEDNPADVPGRTLARKMRSIT